MALNPDEALRKLEAVDWFEGFPPEAREELKAVVRRNVEKLYDPEPFERHPAGLAISVWGDSECIYEEGAYTRLIGDFADGSFGLFRPEKVNEEWGPVEKGERGFARITLSFDHGGRSYRTSFVQVSDYIEEDFFELLDEATGDLSPPMQFTCPDMGFGQDFGMVLSTPGARTRALKADLYPPDFWDEEEEEW